jgi:hypothetical protein
VTIAIQHVVGLVVDVVVFLAMRRLGAKPWLACIPTAVALLSGDYVWFEHQVVAEPFMTAFLVTGLACSLRGLVPRVDLRWLSAGSALLMYAGLCRNLGMVALPVVILGVAFWVRGGYAARFRALAAAIVPALVVFGLYFAAFEISGGQYLGFNDMSGWDLYSRVAPIADCSRFTPPEGTRRLCEDTLAAEREGSLGYSWNEESQGRKVVKFGPQTSGLVGSFAEQVILHEPLSYLKLVGIEATRYVDPAIGGNRLGSGLTHDIQSFGLYDPATREFMEGEMSHGYGGVEVNAGRTEREILGAYQNLFRVSGLLIAVLAIFTVIGMFVACGAVRLGVFLFGATAFLLYLVPVVTLSYEVRYGIPPVILVTISGTLGFAALISRRYPSAFFFGEPLVESIAASSSSPVVTGAAV